MATFIQEDPRTPPSIMLRSRYNISQKEANRLRDELRKKGYTPRQIRTLDIRPEDIPETYRSNKPAQDFKSITEAQTTKRVEVKEGYGTPGANLTNEQLRTYELQEAERKGQTFTLQQKKEREETLEATKTPKTESETDRINRELGEAGIKNASDFFKASREGRLEIIQTPEGRRQISITNKETRLEKVSPDIEYFTFVAPTQENPSGTITGKSDTIKQSDINKFVGNLEIKDSGAKGPNTINAQYLYNLPTKPSSVYYPNVYEQGAYKLEEAGERNPEYKWFTTTGSNIFKNIGSPATEVGKPILEPIINPIVSAIKNPSKTPKYLWEELKAPIKIGSVLVVGTIDFIKNPTPVGQDIINVAQAPFYNEYPKGFQSLTRLGTQYAIAKGFGIVIKGGLKVWDKYSAKWVEPEVFQQRPTSPGIDWETTGKISLRATGEQKVYVEGLSGIKKISLKQAEQLGLKPEQITTAPDIFNERTQTQLTYKEGQAFGYNPETPATTGTYSKTYFDFIKKATPEEISYYNQMNQQSVFETSGKQISSFLFDKEKIALEQARIEGPGEQTKLATKTESGKQMLLYGGQIYGSLYLEGARIGGELFKGINNYWKSIPDEPRITPPPTESPNIKIGNPFIFVYGGDNKAGNPPIIKYESPSAFKETNIYSNKIIDISRSGNKGGTTPVIEPVSIIDTGSGQRGGTRTTPAIIPIPDTDTGTDTETETITDNTTRQTPRTINPWKPINPRKTKPEEPIKPLFKPGKSKTSTIQGFNVFGRSKGIFTKLNTGALTKSQAVNYGTMIIGSTPLASFKIVPSTSPATKSNYSGLGLNQFYKKGSLFIEKPEYRINTIGELQGITYKGISTPKKKKRGRNIWGLAI